MIPTLTTTPTPYLTSSAAVALVMLATATRGLPQAGPLTIAKNLIHQLIRLVSDNYSSEKKATYLLIQTVKMW